MPVFDSLREALPAGRVSLDDADLDGYSHDWWPLSTKERMQGRHGHRPDAVARPRTAAEVRSVLRWANAHAIPVTPRGLGSSVTGAPLPLSGGVVLDLSGLDAILSLDEENLTVHVEAGVRGDRLEQWLAERGYTLGHSPQSLHRSTVGGWLATQATGQFSARYGGIEDLVVGYTVLLGTGEEFALPEHPRASLGPDLRRLFIGSEGTLGVITVVGLKVFPAAPVTLNEALRFPSVAAGLEAMRQITRAGLRTYLLRFYDEDESRHAMLDASFDGCAMFVGSSGLELTAGAEQESALRLCRAAGAEPLGPGAAEAWLARRYDFSTIENQLGRPGGFAETIEVAHTWSQIGSLHADAKRELSPLADELLGHFSHVYPQGTSLYLIFLGQAADDAQAAERISRIWQQSMELAARHGAALSHHHGVGLARLPYIRAAMGGTAVLLDRIKAALDPAGVLSPGKLGLRGTAVPAGRAEGGAAS